VYQEVVEVLETDTRVLDRETLLNGLKMDNRGIGNDTFFFVHTSRGSLRSSESWLALLVWDVGFVPINFVDGITVDVSFN
jgi:hypothetical protein